MVPAPEHFWQFSLALWKEADLRALALALQDHHGLEPNLLLLALWLQRQSQFLDPDQFRRLDRAQRAWCDTVLIPYRRLRRQAKAGLDKAGYRQLLAGELALERRSQALLLEALASLTPAQTGDNGPACLLGAGIAIEALEARVLDALQRQFANARSGVALWDPAIPAPTTEAPARRDPTLRRCPRCGVPFGCCADADCWCHHALPAGTAPLPLDEAAEAEGCLCPRCLREAAAQRQSAG